MKIDFDASAQCFRVQDSLGNPIPLTFSSSLLPPEELENRVRSMLEHVEKHPDAMALLQQSLLNGPIAVVFRPASDTRTGAHWNHTQREIEILAAKTDMHVLLDSFIFELNNSINEGLKNVKIENYNDPESYALATETAEYQTLQRTVPIMDEGIQKYGWPRATENVAHRKHKTLEAWLSDVRLNRSPHHGFSHFEGYMLEYLNIRILQITILKHKKTILENSLAIKQLEANFLEDSSPSKDISDLEKKLAIAALELEAAEKELPDLLRQKEEMIDNAEKWKTIFSKGGEVEQAAAAIEELKLETKKQEGYLAFIRALPEYSLENSALRKATDDFFMAQVEALNNNDSHQYLSHSFDDFIPSIFPALDYSQRRTKILSSALEKAGVKIADDTSESSPATGIPLSWAQQAHSASSFSSSPTLDDTNNDKKANSPMK